MFQQPQRLSLPPLPPPPQAYAVLSASPYSLSPPDSSLFDRWNRSSELDDEGYFASINPFIFKGGGFQRSHDDFGSSEGSDEEGDWKRNGEAPRLKVETPAGEMLPKMVFDIHHRTLAKIELKQHAAVLVVKNRGIPEVVVLEPMPFASRWGCHLLYHGLFKNKRLRNSQGLEELFHKWSEREGRKFDSSKDALHRIMSYVRAYHIDTHELLQTDLSRYATLNDFFFRRLRDGARPIAEPRNPLIISSAADCRLTVFPSIAKAEKLWIKGRQFKLKQLLDSKKLSQQFENGCVAIFRLAPSDYHRYHSPVDAVVGSTKHVEGAYYTVNSLIVRDSRFNPLGENKRDVTLLHHTRVDGTVSTIAFVQIGALLVSSIRQSVAEGAKVRRGDELGYFAYGGSTIACLFEEGSVRWDEDLLRNSTGKNQVGEPVETMVKVGERIGEWTS